jgi:hypothetical protein
MKVKKPATKKRKVNHKRFKSLPEKKRGPQRGEHGPYFNDSMDDGFMSGLSVR